MDGNEFIFAFKKQNAHTPIIAISGGGHGVTSSQALALSQNIASQVLEKPFSKNDLITVEKMQSEKQNNERP